MPHPASEVASIKQFVALLDLETGAQVPAGTAGHPGLLGCPDVRACRRLRHLDSKLARSAT